MPMVAHACLSSSLYLRLVITQTVFWSVQRYITASVNLLSLHQNTQGSHLNQKMGLFSSVLETQEDDVCIGLKKPMANGRQ